MTHIISLYNTCQVSSPDMYEIGKIQHPGIEYSNIGLSMWLYTAYIVPYMRYFVKIR